MDLTTEGDVAHHRTAFPSRAAMKSHAARKGGVSSVRMTLSVASLAGPVPLRSAPASDAAGGSIPLIREGIYQEYTGMFREEGGAFARRAAPLRGRPAESRCTVALRATTAAQA